MDQICPWIPKTSADPSPPNLPHHVPYPPLSLHILLMIPLTADMPEPGTTIHVLLCPVPPPSLIPHC